MSSITVTSLVLGSLTVEVDGSDSTLALSVLGTAPASLSIELGTPGAQGDAATISVGTTTTLSPGSSATVTNVGTSSAAVFNFGIPAGQTGATGATGPGVASGGTAGQSLLKVDGTDYNTTWGTPALASHAETTQATVRNNTGSTLTPGQIVYINGALGNRPTVALSQANAEATSAGTYAMVEASIANNTDGTVITSGTVMYLDTSALTEGDKLYLSPTTAGAWTTTKPSAPNHLVYIGTVTRAHPTQGTVQLRIQNGYELDELHDVAIASKTNNDLLAYESATSLWKNKSFTTLGLLTSSTAASTYAPLASPTLTGTPLTTTAAADTNTTQIASTAFVVGQASSTAPSNDAAAAAVGTSLKYARADHVHLNPLPTGGTANQVLQKNSSTNYDVSWVTASSGGSVDVQTFGSSSTSGSFTWTKPANAKLVHVFMWGAGGSGGSGACQPTTNARYGGGGGAGGTFTYLIIPAAYLNSTETVVVGAGGSSPAGVNTTSTGNNGFDGGQTTFKTWKAPGGNLGSGGTTVSGTAGGGKTSYTFLSSNFAGSAGAGTTANGSAGSAVTSITHQPTGGGGGGGCAAGAATGSSGGNGASISTAINNSGISASIAGGTAASSTVVAGAGVTTNGFYGGTGGGGGAYRPNNTNPALFNGAAGGWPGGGGGGGGAADTGVATSGSGGAGANGYVYILTIT